MLDGDRVPDASPFAHVLGVRSTDPAICILDDVNRVPDGSRIRLAAADQSISAYARRGDGNALLLYEDAALTRPAKRDTLAPGMDAIQLAADDWAVVIALNYYYSPGIRQLNGALEDAKRFVHWVKDAACVPEDQLILVKSCDGQPTAEELAIPTVDSAASAFTQLFVKANVLPGKRLGRRLYIFCSGHGIVPLQQATQDYREAALLMASAALENNYARHIPTRGYAEWFRAHGIFDEVILFVDCCRDVQNNVPLNVLQLPTFTRERAEGRQFYALPTRLGEKAWEAQKGDPPVWRGVFSYALIEALNDPALHDDKGILTGSLLRDSLYQSFPELADRQHATIDYDPQVQEIALIRRANYRAPEAVISFAPAAIGQQASLYGFGARGKLTLIDQAVVPADAIWRIGVGLNTLYKVVVGQSEELFETKGAETHVSVG